MGRFERHEIAVWGPLQGVDSGLGGEPRLGLRGMRGGKLFGELQSRSHQRDLAFQGQLGVLEGALLEGECARGGLDHREHQGFGLQEIRELLLDGEGVAHGGVVVEAVCGFDDGADCSNFLRRLQSTFRLSFPRRIVLARPTFDLAALPAARSRFRLHPKDRLQSVTDRRMDLETAPARLIQHTNNNKEKGMSIISRQRKDLTTAHQVILRPLGGRTITKTFDDFESARMFEEMTEQEMATTRLRMALASRMKQGVKDFAMATKIPEGGEDPKMAQANYDNELLSVTMDAYMKSSECATKSCSEMPTILKTVGNVRLGELKKRWVRQYIDHLRSIPTQFGEPYAYSTIQGYISTINCAVRWRAEEYDLNPVPLPFSKRTMFPRGYDNSRTRRLAHEELLALFSSLREVQGNSNRHYRLLTRFALETGARLQEMVLADWSEFDLNRGTWSIPASHVKTGYGRASPLTPRARRVLGVLWAMRDMTSPRVFHLLGKPESVSSVFARVVKRAGLEDFHFHDLRHMAVSQMVLKQTISVERIMQMVGHGSLGMLRRYTNLRPEEIVPMLR